MKILAILRKLFNITQEELAKKLSLETNTIALYEAGKLSPSFKVLDKLIEIYQISFDYLLLNDKCMFPRNIGLLKIAKKLDDLSKSEGRSIIESTSKSFLKEKINENISLKNDLIDLQFTKDFNSNLKLIRNYKKLSQEQLAKLLNIPRSSLSSYEQKKIPSFEKLIKLSETLNISIHALATGKKLNFEFQDRHFGTTILLADHYLSLEDQKILIKLMENIINA